MNINYCNIQEIFVNDLYLLLKKSSFILYETQRIVDLL